MRTIINTTPHDIRFILADGTETTVKPSGVLMNAKVTEQVISTEDGITLVRPTFEQETASLTALEELEAKNPGALIIGSLVAAQAYPGRVLGMTPAKGYERVPVDQKKMDGQKFSTY